MFPGCRPPPPRCRPPLGRPPPPFPRPPPLQELEGLDTYLAHYQGGGGLGSQAVQGVLDRWIDVNKRNILEGWLGHVLHGGPVDAANGNFVPRVQMSSLSKEVCSLIRPQRAENVARCRRKGCVMIFFFFCTCSSGMGTGNNHSRFVCASGAPGEEGTRRGGGGGVVPVLVPAFVGIG